MQQQRSLHQLRPARQCPSHERSVGGFLAFDVDRAGFRLQRLDGTRGDSHRGTVTAAMKVSTIVRAMMMVTVTITTTVKMSSAPMLLTTSTGADKLAMILGDPLRGRAFRSNRPAGDFHCNPCRLRSLRSLRAPLARRLAALTAVAGPAPSSHRSTASVARPSCPPRDGAMRRARHCPRLARPRRLRRQRASPRLVAAALRASPVSASPSTGARTAPCSRVRTSADSAADATADVLRTTPCSTRCTSRRSSAAVAPTSRCRRRRFPEHRCCRFGRPDRPGRPRFSHPTHR